MADNKPTENSMTYEDPFSDYPRHPRFKIEPTSPRPSPYESTASLSLAEDSLHDPYDEDEYIEKQPLNAAQGFAGGFYPPP
jgi:chitin synthase